jgi:hypothetical protein
MVLLAIGLEIALHFSNKQHGWKTFSAASTDYGFMHYVYTFPPIIVAMIIVAVIAWTDMEIKKMQPYIDLLNGDSPPQMSLLLDYTRLNNFVVWMRAFWNHHYMVAFATLIALAALLFQPLGGAMFTVRDTWTTSALTNVPNMAILGLNQSPEFQDVTTFLSASGYASSSVLYNLGDPPFIHSVYTIGEFQIPTTSGNNGTVFANTTAVKTDPNCSLMSTVSTQISIDGISGWKNDATWDGCTFSYTVTKSTSHLFGTNVMPDCNNTGTPDWFRPIVVWFFTYDTSPPQGSATQCAPTISLWEVEVQVDIGSMNLTSVQEIRPFNATTSPFSEAAANLTALNGQAYNGVAFDAPNPDQFVLQRENATNLMLPASILQAASSGSGGLTGAFASNSFTGMAIQVYTMYMKLVAKSAYFVSPATSQDMTIQVKMFEKRLWLSDVAVHLEAFLLLLIALFGTVIQLFHRQARQQLNLCHEPGTIASAVSIGAETSMAHLLNGRQAEGDFVRALQNRKFRIDPRTMKIVMQGEPGYEQAASPNPRTSIFGSFGMSTSPRNKRFSNILHDGEKSPI